MGQRHFITTRICNRHWTELIAAEIGIGKILRSVDRRHSRNEISAICDCNAGKGSWWSAINERLILRWTALKWFHHCIIWPAAEIDWRLSPLLRFEGCLEKRRRDEKTHPPPLLSLTSQHCSPLQRPHPPILKPFLVLAAPSATIISGLWPPLSKEWTAQFSEERKKEMNEWNFSHVFYYNLVFQEWLWQSNEQLA